MQEWMRKHRRLIQVFILAFIGIPMVVFFGMPSGNRAQETGTDNIIAQVGGVPIMESEFRRRLDAVAAQRTHPETGRPTYRDLDRDGAAQRVLDQLIDASLIKIQEQQRPFDVDESLLGKQLQEADWFKDENGNFNREAWNEWVSSVARWDAIYDELRETVTRQVFLGTVTAPGGRILERKIDDELLAEQTKIRVKYAKVELAIDMTEEEIQAHYDENPDMYREPELHQAEFVAISVTPEPPELAYELVQRARDGEDFAALADEYSDQKQPEGGAMGWRRAGDFVSPHLEPFFDLTTGQVSDPVLGPTGYHIYKAEEERINELLGQVELSGRQIVLNVELDEETLAARTQLANEIAAEIRETADTVAVAAKHGLEVLRTNYFNPWKLEIDNIPFDDLYRFRGQILSEEYIPWQPIVAKRNIYIGQVIETREGDLKPFEDVHDDIVENIKNEHRREEEYQEHLSERIEVIKDRVANLDAIISLDSELDAETGETEEFFSRQDSLFQQKIYVQTRDIFNVIKDKDIGEVGGPLQGLLGGYWFFQLLERDAPDPEKLAEMKEERNAIKERLIQTAQFEILSDYTKDLRERMLASVNFRQDVAAYDRILERGLEEEAGLTALGDEIIADVTDEDAVEDIGDDTKDDAGDDAGEDTEDDMTAADADIENAAAVAAPDNDVVDDVADVQEAPEEETPAEGTADAEPDIPAE